MCNGSLVSDFVHSEKLFSVQQNIHAKSFKILAANSKISSLFTNKVGMYLLHTIYVVSVQHWCLFCCLDR